MDIIEIKSWFSPYSVLWSGEASSLKDAAVKAVAAKANLSGADLSRANLIGADLSRANLSGADLSGADLSGAYLSGADLSRANLSYADLSRANLSGADLRGANLSRANLIGADLSGAVLSGADLSGATLPDGRTWEEYQKDSLKDICSTPEARSRAIAAWGNHSWKDCPMHAAHGWSGMNQVPEEQRIKVAAFVAVFDARFLSSPTKE